MQILEIQNWIILKCILLLLCLNFIQSQQTSVVEDLLDWCIDAKHHKSKPGPEGLLYGQCTPWKDRSCCTANTTTDLHLDIGASYNFNFDHCAEKKPLSQQCKKHFIQDQCFYECSPNVGPWTVKEKRSWRNERFYKVPLCESDCQVWYEDCKDDYTCTDNWSTNFEWVTLKSCPSGKTCKTNICPSGSICQTFKEIYGNAIMFCDRVWDHSWEFTADDEPCMRLWFDGSAGNPNDRVASWKAALISNAESRKPFDVCSVFAVIYIFVINITVL